MSDAYSDLYGDVYGGSDGRFRFIPPTVDKKRDTGDQFSTRFSTGKRGLTVLITDGVATEKRYITSTAAREADYVYLGGHEHIIDEVAAYYLEQAGYTVTEVDE